MIGSRLNSNAPIAKVNQTLLPFGPCFALGKLLGIRSLHGGCAVGRLLAFSASSTIVSQHVG